MSVTKTTPEQEALIIKLYEEQNMPLKQIAASVHISVDRVRLCLQRHNKWTPSKPHSCKLPEQDIIRLYKQDVSVADIATTYNVSTSPIVSILKKHNVRKPNQFKSLSYQQYEQLIDKKWFEAQVQLHVSKANVGKALSLNHDMVTSLYEYHNIESSGSSAGVRSLLNQRKALVPLNEETMRDMHLNQYVPMSELAELTGVSPGYLRRMFDKWNIVNWDRGTIRISPEWRQIRDNPDVLSTLVVHHTLNEITTMYKVGFDTLSKTLKRFNIPLPFRSRSAAEIEIGAFIESLGIEVKFNDRQLLHPKELDIVIPSHKLAIEYCGLFWHTEQNGKHKNYHLDKTLKCEEQGFRLLTIFEDEYIHNKTLVQNQIKQALGCFDGVKISARDCTVTEISFSQKRDFLNRYHVQGNDVSAVYYGLMYESTLVAVMTFSKPSRVRSGKTKPEGHWELNRYCTHHGYSIRGGAGKLLAAFKRTHAWSLIYSYADRRYSVGTLYKQLGFVLDSVSKPNYWYWTNGLTKRIYRYEFAKFKLVEQGFDASKTEFQIMEERGYTKIWDCGMLKYVITNEDNS